MEIVATAVARRTSFVTLVKNTSTVCSLLQAGTCRPVPNMRSNANLMVRAGSDHSRGTTVDSCVEVERGEGMRKMRLKRPPWQNGGAQGAHLGG